MNERATLCVGSWQAAMSLGIIEIIDDTEHSYGLSPHSWFNMEQKCCLEKRVDVVFGQHRAVHIFVFQKEYLQAWFETVSPPCERPRKRHYPGSVYSQVPGRIKNYFQKDFHSIIFKRKEHPLRDTVVIVAKICLTYFFSSCLVKLCHFYQSSWNWVKLYCLVGSINIFLSFPPFLPGKRH